MSLSHDGICTWFWFSDVNDLWLVIPETHLTTKLKWRTHDIISRTRRPYWMAYSQYGIFLISLYQISGWDICWMIHAYRKTVCGLRTVLTVFEVKPEVKISHRAGTGLTMSVKLQFNSFCFSRKRNDSGSSLGLHLYWTISKPLQTPPRQQLWCDTVRGLYHSKSFQIFQMSVFKN